MWIWLEPLDVLLFRDSRPFTGGESHRARSLFPPSPLSFQGAIRTLIIANELAKSGYDFNDFRDYLLGRTFLGENFPRKEELEGILRKVGDAEGFGELRILGPFIARRNKAGYETFFPLPLDIYLRADGEGGESQPVVLSPLHQKWEEKPGYDRSWPSSLLPLWSEWKVEEALGYWITGNGFKEYLLGESGDYRWLCRGLYLREPRLGIKLRPTRTVEQGMLYMADFIRLEKGVGFFLEVKAGSEELLEPLRGAGVMALGGEGRAVWREEVSTDPLFGLKALKRDLIAGIRDLFKVVLISPAIFHQGWKPDFLGEGLVGEVGGVRVELMAAAVGKPIGIGGWDLAFGRPKALRWAVPPGSVFYFRIVDGQVEEAVEAFHFATTLQELAGDGRLRELGKIGFAPPRWHRGQRGRGGSPDPAGAAHAFPHGPGLGDQGGVAGSSKKEGSGQEDDRSGFWAGDGAGVGARWGVDVHGCPGFVVPGARWKRGFCLDHVSERHRPARAGPGAAAGVERLCAGSFRA